MDFEPLFQKLEKAIDDHPKLRRFTENPVLLQAGADRNAMRHAEADGLRLLAWFAKYVDQGADPLKTLIQMATEAGLDVDPADYEWTLDD